MLILLKASDRYLVAGRYLATVVNKCLTLKFKPLS